MLEQRQVYLLAATLAWGATAPVLGQEVDAPAPVPEEVVAFATAFQEAVRAYDVDAWTAMVSEDVVMMAPNGRSLEGRGAFHDLWSRTFEGATGTNPLSLRILGSKRDGGLMAVRLAYGPEGADPVGRYVWLLERDPDGALVLAWWIFTGGA